MSEAKIKEETHKLKNLIRLFHATKSVPTEEVTRNSLQNYITEVSSCRSSRDLWDRFNMEELLLRLHPILEGKEISESISRTTFSSFRDLRAKRCQLGNLFSFNLVVVNAARQGRLQ